MTWWLRLWRRDRMETELERELRFHQDEHAADLVARGVHPDEARRQTRLALGGPEQVAMEQLVAASLDRQRFLLLLFGVFAGVALLLACVGIYGVLAYLTSQRVPEFGVGWRSARPRATSCVWSCGRALR